ncbi:YunG family protein [Sphaerisporangium sp. NPDC004334]
MAGLVALPLVPMSGRCLGEMCQRHMAWSGMPITADELRPYFRSAWGADTCHPDSREEWSPQNPARDQCGMTALVVQDILGGDLILGEVHVGGVQIGHHYWNRLPDGFEVDFTADQFRPDEQVVGGRVVARPPDAPRRHREQYEHLRERVREARWPPTRGSETSHDSAAGGARHAKSRLARR